MPLEAFRKVHGAARAETARLAALDRLGVLDTAPEPAFDDIVRQAAERFGMPVALVSLIDVDRQWFKAAFGLDATESPRGDALCNHAIRSDEVMVVPDAAADPRFSENPFVTGETGLRFYAGAPLTVAGGLRIGTLCVIDRQPRADFGPEHAAALAALAAEVAAELARREVAAATAPDAPAGSDLED